MITPIPLGVPDLCCGCGETFTTRTPVGPRGPQRSRPLQGELAICVNCAQLHKMGPDGFLLEATDQDLRSLSPWGVVMVTHTQQQIRERGPIRTPKQGPSDA